MFRNLLMKFTTRISFNEKILSTDDKDYFVGIEFSKLD